MTLTIILGNLGSGKTFIMTLLTYSDIRKIWSNYKINRKNTKFMEVVDLLDLPDNIVILMDEAYAWIESRVSSSTLNEYLSSILFHTRKTNTDIYLTTPMFSTIDKRFRHQANFIILCEHRENFEFDDFHFTIYNVNNNSYGNFSITYERAKKYFKLYNTYEKVESHRKKGLQFNILKKYPKRLKDYIIELTELVSHRLNGKITHDIVKDCLLMEGIDLSYEPLIYIRLKGKQHDFNKNK